ncbi:MAG: hypothetical protein CMM94_08405 [Rickettsiales bacterium]|nr:hypothetical protein [Rickettsiales bacterium]
MKQGFSLVELSIVLVILGLLTGGILAGQNLIRAAELRAVTTQINNFSSAVHTFRDKYFALPGDMLNAQAFWGAEPAASCPGTAATPSTSSATCNGNGNGLVNISTDSNEMFRAWQHLANAGLIEGSYSGVQGALRSDHAIPDENAPRMKLDNATVHFQNYGSRVSTDPNFFEGQYTNVLLIGREQTTGGFPHAPFLKPGELWNIDTKIDDGRPGTGGILSWNNTFKADCTTTNNIATSEYALGNENVSCSLISKPLN